MAETSETDIDGIHFISHMIAPIAEAGRPSAYVIAPRVAKIMLPIIAELPKLGDLTEKGLTKLLGDPSGIAKVVPILERFTAALSEPENARLPQDLLCRTQVDIVNPDTGDKRRVDLSSLATINEVFRGKFLTMLKVMWFAAAHNFADFFAGASRPNQTKG